METKELDSRINRLKIDLEKLVNDFNKETDLHIDYLQVIPKVYDNQIIVDSYQSEIVFKY